MRIRYYLTLTAFLLGSAPLSALAQVQPTPRSTTSLGDTTLSSRFRSGTGNPDVMLEIPNLHVDSLGLTVDRVEARLALEAQVANLVSLRAGADVFIGQVQLSLTGVDAEAYLYVYLDDVVTIVNRTLQTLDENPEILQTLGSTLQQTVGTVGDVAGQALGPGGAVSSLTQTLGQTLQDVSRPGGLLDRTVNTLGQTVTRTLSQTGSITETVFDEAGAIVSQQNLGSVSGLSNVVNEATNQAGQMVRRVRDQSGNVIEYTLDQAGRVSAARVVESATGN